MEEESRVGTGAAIGAVGGGIAGSAAAGAAVGAAIGALAGKATKVDAVAEDNYWPDNYSSRPYANSASYDDYDPAYSYGSNAYEKRPGRSFDDVEPKLGSGWTGSRDLSSLE